ncbi:MAG: DNA repair protein RadA [Abditibacteriales bacterium]|nr:DNA repair protein RadA [Abditibacteriales bacterium]MDW8365751.1 DNA repair protein RadA [Abditibacteriales bacterium]
MPKAKSVWVCQHCGHEAPKWLGRCPECEEFNSFVEELKTPAATAPARLVTATTVEPLADVQPRAQERMATGIGELDRVLGGGVVPGSVVLVGGDPGIGKSTLLLQAGVRLSQAQGKGLYVSGEESAEQIRWRADRLGLSSSSLLLVSATDLAQIEAQIDRHAPAFVIVDSIQTVSHPDLDSPPGTISQVRESAAALVKIAKSRGIPIFLVGHVNKEGAIAGPKALEHIVDTVLTLEGDSHHAFRILRAVKNRFGSTNEIGVFEMKERGMEEVENPSRLFLSERLEGAPGSAVVATMEGSRPLLVEMQALVAPTYFGTPRRLATGADYNRVCIILAVLDKRLGMHLGDMDAYVNVVGGMRITEPAADLGVALAVASSLRERAPSADTVVFGEIGLAGEVRAVSHPERRVMEAQRLGFARCVLPSSNLSHLSQSPSRTVKLVGVRTVREALDLLLAERNG